MIFAAGRCFVGSHESSSSHIYRQGDNHPPGRFTTAEARSALFDSTCQPSWKAQLGCDNARSACQPTNDHGGGLVMLDALGATLGAARSAGRMAVEMRARPSRWLAGALVDTPGSKMRARPRAGRYSAYEGPVLGPAFAWRNRRAFVWFIVSSLGPLRVPSVSRFARSSLASRAGLFLFHSTWGGMGFFFGARSLVSCVSVKAF